MWIPLLNPCCSYLRVRIENNILGQVLDCVRAAKDQSRSRVEGGAPAVWGPDGKDLFEQMARPLQARMADLLSPVHAELRELRSIMMAAAVSESSNVTEVSRRGPDRLAPPGLAEAPRAETAAAPSLGLSVSPTIGPISPGWLPRPSNSSAAAPDDNASQLSSLLTWAQGLEGPLKSPMMQLADWVDSRGSSALLSPQPEALSTPVLPALAPSLLIKSGIVGSSREGGKPPRPVPAVAGAERRAVMLRGADMRAAVAAAPPAKAVPTNDVVMLVRSDALLRSTTHESSTGSSDGEAAAVTIQHYRNRAAASTSRWAIASTAAATTAKGAGVKSIGGRRHGVASRGGVGRGDEALDRDPSRGQDSDYSAPDAVEGQTSVHNRAAARSGSAHPPHHAFAGRRAASTSPRRGTTSRASGVVAFRDL